MGYLDTLKPNQRKNAEIIIKRLNAKGITNPNSQAGILSIVSKESEFIPRDETTYRNTSNARIRQIFGSRVAQLSDPELSALKANDIAFYDQVYGMKWPQLGLGNDKPGDGYKYRGRGFNGITGKYSYAKYGKAIGVDLVNKPDLANDVAIATDILVEYYKDQFKNPKNKLENYNSTGINDFKNVQDSTAAFYHATAGWGKSMRAINADVTGGRGKAIERAPGFLDYVKQFTGQTIDLAKKKPVETLVVSALLTIVTYFVIKSIVSSKKKVNNQ